MMVDQPLLKQRYQVLSTIGQGAFGVSYLALDQQTKRRCVVKVLSLRQVDTLKTQELFEREARVLASLDHPRIPRFVDFFSEESETDTRICLVQEHVDGENLARLVARGRRFHEEEVIAIGLEVSKILEYLQGFSPPILHRDIKPSNILITRERAVYLIDFGAVRDKVLHDPLLEPGGPTIVGTYGYMPIEQFEGQATPASDIYSLGASLIHILSGKEPWQLEKDGMHLDFRPHVNVSRRFARTLDRMIRPDWRERHASATLLREELERLSSPPIRWRWRPRKLLPAGAAAGLALLAAILLPLIGRTPAPTPRIRVVPRAVSPTVSVLRWLPSDRDAQGDRLPDHALRRLGTVRLRHGGPVRAVAFSPDDRTIASASEDRTVSLWSVKTGEEQRRIETWRPAVDVAFPPDGRRIAVATVEDGMAELWDLGSGRTIARLRPIDGMPPGAARVHSVAFSRDGTLATRSVHAIDLWGGRDGRHRRRVADCAFGRTVAFLPETGELLAACREQELTVYDPETGRQSRRLPVKADNRFSISRDGRILATLSADGIAIWEVGSDRKLRTLDDPEFVSSGGVQALALSADGRALAAALRDGRVLVMGVDSGGRQWVLDGHDGAVNAVAFSRDGKRLASGGQDHTVRLWDLGTGQSAFSFGGHSEPVRRLDFSPTGDRLASAGADGTLREWNRDGTQIHDLKLGRDVAHLSYLPDSRVLVAERDRFQVFGFAAGQPAVQVASPVAIHGVAVAPKSGLLAAGGSATLQIHELSSGRQYTWPVPAPEEPLAFSRDGRILATLRDAADRSRGRALVLRDSVSGREVLRKDHRKGGPFPSACRSRDGSFFMFNGAIWQVTSSPRPGLIEVDTVGGGSMCVVSEDESLLAFRHGQTDVVDVRERVFTRGRSALRRVAWIRGHRGPITALALSPDGRTLATGGADSSVLVWDIATLRRAYAPSPPPVPPSDTTVAGDTVRRDGPRIGLSFDGQLDGTGIETVCLDTVQQQIRFVTGRVGQALHLTTELAFPETARIRLGDAFTVAFWFRLDDGEAFRSRTQQTVLRSDLVSLSVNPEARAFLTLYFWNHGGHASADLTPWLGPVVPGRWYHVAASYRRATAAVRICVDGVCGEGPGGAEYSDRIGELRLGFWSPPWRFEGAVDELAIYDRTLSDTEIAAAALVAGLRTLTGTSPAATPSPSAQQAVEPAPGLDEDISSLVSVEPQADFTTYRFTGDLARVQTLDLDVGLRAVWVGTSRGLLRRDADTGRWRRFAPFADRSGDRMDRIAVVGESVIAGATVPTGVAVASSRGVCILDTANRTWAPLPVGGSVWELWGDGQTLWAGLGNGAEARDLSQGTVERFSRLAGQLRHDAVHAIRRSEQFVWFAMLGEHVKERGDFEGGGVTVWDRNSGQFVSYSTRDGLARDYSCDLAVDEREVFVAHWDEAKGLSVFDRAAGRWTALMKSSNGIDLGGVVLALDRHTLWIGQQRGLVRLDRRSREARLYTAAQGLPGYIVSGIAISEDAVWASVYGNGQGGIDTAGLVRLPR